MTFFEKMDDDRIPGEIRERLQALREEVDAIVDAAMQNLVTEVPRRISYKLSGA